ncbi:DUF1800 domain-containing protein [Kribbella sandramycini]|uniref:DUF1800 domain-containing protein n=1 Tax=Kribbella sandramycini TaxID=60450 RepID=A0A7Y4NYV6_9ACTN|nr:DUF1800 domain-containing protein [Kribbella sandramycini]MBB6568087.1 uncharacterized protein (DUF1800 family) [Kribbella sandramycini]NOL39319.1 DUF1800 domain-containing protein [Kribbella sandramycini]
MTEISEQAAVRRLNDRLGFGPAPGEPALGFEETVRRLLGPAADAAAAAIAPPTGLAPPPRDKENKKADRQTRTAQERKLTVWWLDRMVAGRTASERLTWFWHGHFATSNQKVRNAAWMLAQNQTQRQHALGRFGDLATAMIVDSATIRWLDGQRNRKGSPNENLAREFLELFTLGIGHYAEKDVAEGARCLTGWVLGKDGKPATFRRQRFDSGTKTVLGRSGNFDAKGYAGLALARPESAPFVIGRLWFRLVSATPPDAATLARLQTAYGAERNVKSLLTAMVGEAAFRDPASALVKQPVEWAVGLLRALRLTPGKLEQQEQTKLLAGLRGMGQLSFRPPSVGGWPSGASWLTTSAGVTRLQLAQHLAGLSDLGAIKSADAAADLLGVDGWSARTKAALAQVKAPAQLVAIAACAPEYVVSG